MKRTIFFRIISAVVILGYFSLIFASLQFKEIPFYQFWFSGFLIGVGVLSLVRYFCYIIDSALYLGVVSLFCGVAGVLNYFLAFNLPILFALYFSSFAVGSLSIFLKFRHFFHLKVFVFALLCVILLLLLGYELLPLVAFIVFFCVIVLIIIAMIISSIKANTRKV